MIFWWFALSIGTLFRKAGIIPAYQISKLKPVDARYELEVQVFEQKNNCRFIVGSKQI